MADNNQNKAEQYRQERKERLAKAAKKNAKNMEKSIALRSAVKKVIAIVLVAVIALGCAYGILDYAGVVNQAMQLGYVGNEKISFSEYIFHYNNVFNDLYQTEQYYKYYGYQYSGYDVSLAPQDQTGKYKDPATGEEKAWVDYFHDQAVKTAQMYLALYQEAVKAGLELTDAEEAAIDKQIEEMRKTADTAGQTSEEDTNKGYSLSAYLRMNYGNGITEGFFKKQLKLQALVQKYYDTKMDEFSAGYTADEVKAVLNKDADAYSFVDIRLYEFKKETLEKKDGEKDADLKKRQEASDKQVKVNATAMFNAVSDEKSFVAQATKYKNEKDYDANTATLLRNFAKAPIGDYTNALENVNADLAKWAFDKATKAGDKKFVEDKESGTCYVALMVNTKHDTKTVDVRHILFSTTDAETGEALSDEEIKKAEADAKQALADWKSAKEQTEDLFAENATNLSDDPGSAENGGLYENVIPGQMVKEFDSWIFDANRKAGDVELVKTDFGYHLIYFIEGNDSFADKTIRSELATEDLNKLSEDILKSDEYKVGIGPRRAAYLEEEMLKKIKVMVTRASSQNASTATTY